MRPINRTIQIGAMINFLQKLMLKRKMNEFPHPKHKVTNCFTKNVENKLLKNMKNMYISSTATNLNK